MHIRNSEIPLAMNNVSGICEGFKHLWSEKSDWNIQGNKFSDKCNNLIFLLFLFSLWRYCNQPFSLQFSARGRKKELQKSSILCVKGVKLLFTTSKVKHLELLRAKSIE